MSPMTGVDLPALGDRLRVAREGAGLTQAKVAEILHIARTTLVAIEAGQRRPRLDELQRMGVLFGTSVNALLRREAVHIDLRPRFRKVGETSADVSAAVGLLTELVRAEVELEQLLGVVRVRSEPPERPMLPGDVVLQAEQDAFELRQWLGLGLGPIADVVSFLELHLGMRVYVRRLPGNISGLYAYDERVGPCVLLNGAHPRERQRQTGLHEVGHYISTRRAPDALHEGTPETTREERYANAFARAFLTPARAVMAQFQNVTAGAKQLTRRHIIVLAHAFEVSREALVRRLEELRLTKPGTWDWFEANGGISDQQARQVLGQSPVALTVAPAAHSSVPTRLALLASEAWERELLSEGQLANLLHIDRLELRELLTSLEAERTGEDAQLQIPR